MGDWLAVKQGEKMKKIAFIDLLFNWPPNAGAVVDLKEVIYGIKDNFQVKLFVPDFSFLLKRGIITEKLDFEIEKVHFNFLTFNYYTVVRKFTEAIDRYNPDIVFIGDGHFLKFRIAYNLSKRYRVILREYTYDIPCPLLFWYDYRKGKNCDNSIFKDHLCCTFCVTGHIYPSKIFVRFLKHIIPKKLYGKIMKIHFNPMFYEYYIALAFLPSYKKILLETLKNAAHIIVYNDFTKDILKDYNRNISVIPTGIDINRFIPIDKEDKEIKRILLSGRITDPLKGYEILKKACAILWKKRHDFQLSITYKETELFKEEEPFINNLGWVKNSDLPALYQKSDICVIPSVWRESLGIVALEAMACSIPVIASDTGGLKQTLIDGVTGYLFPPGDYEKLAEKLDYLLDNQDIRKKMGHEGRKNIEERYNWDRIIKNYYIPLFERL
jgi:glycosyltransferase involved in cell wall biosynthesis